MRTPVRGLRSHGGRIVATLAAVAVCVPAALALAAAPVRGGHYKGKNTDAFAYPVTLTVSKSGKRVSRIKFAVFVPCIGEGNEIPFNYFHKIAIRHGKFHKKRLTGKIKHSTGGTATAVVSGRFRKHRRAVGKISEKRVLEQGKGNKPITCTGKTSWKARAK